MTALFAERNGNSVSTDFIEDTVENDYNAACFVCSHQTIKHDNDRTICWKKR